MSEQKLAAGCFRERELSTRVNRAEMIEIALGAEKLQYVRWIGSGPNAEEAVKWQFSDAGLHTCITSNETKLSHRSGSAAALQLRIH